jgi:hypothetical protein
MTLDEANLDAKTAMAHFHDGTKREEKGHNEVERVEELRS